MNEFGLSDNAMRVFRETPKYCLEKETVDECFQRVAKEYAKNEGDYELAYNLLKEHKWRPNTPVFFNSGSKHKVFAACYVADVSDSMDSIYDTANVARKIFQHGSGIGIPIGNLRERDGFIFEGEGPKEGFVDAVPESRSSGPIVFMKLYDAVAETTRSGGRVRRAAILCAMQVSHPDILEFISSKKIDNTLSNMNISVAISDDFMERLQTNTPFELKSVYSGETVREIDPNDIWDALVDMSWQTADPGILFIDNINRMNALKKTTQCVCSNPCGEN